MTPNTTSDLSAEEPVGIPQGINLEAVRKRKATLVQYGTHPLIAEKLAIDAEEQQMHLNARTAAREEAEEATRKKAAELDLAARQWAARKDAEAMQQQAKAVAQTVTDAVKGTQS